MSIDEIKSKLNTLLIKYPNDFRIINSSEEIDKNKIDILNSDVHGPFNNGDLRIIEILTKSLSSGKQAFILPLGTDRILVQTAKIGKLFNVNRSSRDENVSKIMNSLEEIHDHYLSSDGNPYLYGGFDSYIYPEKFVGLAEKFGYSKFASYDIADTSVLGTVRRFVDNREIVLVSAWTKEDRIDVYVRLGEAVQTEVPVFRPNQTLPIVSLGLSAVGVITICCWGGFPFGIAAIVMGFLAMNNSINNPDRFGGRGLAIAGMAIGAIVLLISSILALIALLGSIR
jgi:hypothetical protein